MKYQDGERNVALGILGACLGGLIGGGSFVLLGKLGMFASVASVILSYCTLWFCRLMGGKLKIDTLLFCIVVLLVTPYLSYRIEWALAIMTANGWGFVEAFKNVHTTVAERGIQTAFWKDLIFFYAFTAVCTFSILYSSRKLSRQV